MNKPRLVADAGGKRREQGQPAGRIAAAATQLRESHFELPTPLGIARRQFVRPAVGGLGAVQVARVFAQEAVDEPRARLVGKVAEQGVAGSPGPRAVAGAEERQGGLHARSGKIGVARDRRDEDHRDGGAERPRQSESAPPYDARSEDRLLRRFGVDLHP